MTKDLDVILVQNLHYERQVPKKKVVHLGLDYVCSGKGSGEGHHWKNCKLELGDWPGRTMSRYKADKCGYGYYKKSQCNGMLWDCARGGGEAYCECSWLWRNKGYSDVVNAVDFEEIKARMMETNAETRPGEKKWLEG
jgi:hypothetical protein